MRRNWRLRFGYGARLGVRLGIVWGLIVEKVLLDLVDLVRLALKDTDWESD